MLASSPIPKQTVGRTFFIAIITLGVVALIQLSAVGWAFIDRFHSTPHIALRGIPSAGQGDAKFVDPYADERRALQEPVVPGPTPISKNVLAPPVSPEQGRLNEMLDQARILRDRGDMSTALTKLREAQAFAPDDPGVLSELATTYEKMEMKDKAMELWQRIFAMGKSAGAYYALAAEKINPDIKDAPDTTKPDAEGIQTGSVMALMDITKVDSDDAPGKKFKLSVPVKSRPGVQIDVQDVGVYVLFYEQMDDGSVVQTNANVTHKFTTSPVDWTQNNIQILEVGYSAASLDAKIKHPENRAYFGYIVRLYYKGNLQDVRADPVKLLKQYPPELTLSNEDMR